MEEKCRLVFRGESEPYVGPWVSQKSGNNVRVVLL